MEFKGIRISGPPGSGKTALAKRLSTITSWQRYSVGAVFREKYELPENKKRFPTFQEYWASTTLEENLEADRLAAKKVEELLNSGQGVVFDSRFHYAVLKFPLLGVFVNASLEVRAARQFATPPTQEELKKMMDYLGLRERDECTKAMKLGENFGQPDFSYLACPYGLSLQSDKLTLEKEVEIVLKELGLLKEEALNE